MYDLPHPSPAPRSRAAKSHSFHPIGLTYVHYQVCGKCGLIKLKNQETERRVRQACPGRED